MRTPNLKVVVALALCIAFCFGGAAFSQSAPMSKNSAADLDALAKRLIAEQHVVGASVLVAQNDAPAPALPATGSSLPLVALFGMLALAGALAMGFAQKRAL